MLHLAIQACRKAGKYVGICGQDRPIILSCKWLMEEGIESLSLNQDAWWKPGCILRATLLRAYKQLSVPRVTFA